MSGVKITACSYVRNEEKNIDACLSLIRPYVDEIIIYDLESTDNTFELCKKYTTEVFKVPFTLCGDGYRESIAYKAKGDWLLWFYPDERWLENVMKMLKKVVLLDNEWTAYAFMRHEYMDDIRVGYNREDKLVYFGSPENPNYQIRLHKKDGKIFYTELVHSELHGGHTVCALPPEYYIEHQKTSTDQELDNVRLYIWYKYLIWKYGDTTVEPYKTYVDSYRKIVRDSETAMKEGNRRVHPAEENWWKWRDYPLVGGGKIVDKAVLETTEFNEK